MNENSGQVGFVGLGTMGGGMARNLLRAGFDVVAYDRTPARSDSLVAAGAEAAGSPRKVAERCKVVFTCVSDTPDVEQVLFGLDGIADGLRAGALVVDTSTVSPAATREWAYRLADRGVGFLDAPVSGGSEGAENGTLAIMAGGDAAHLERARPYLDAIGATVTHMGDVGAGQTCKLVNQILASVNLLAVAEALVFAKAGGLDLDKTIAAVRNGAAGSWLLANRGPQIVHDDWRPGFTIELQQKISGSCSKQPTSSVYLPSPPARSSTSTRHCNATGWAMKATTPSSRPSNAFPASPPARRNPLVDTADPPRQARQIHHDRHGRSTTTGTADPPRQGPELVCCLHVDLELAVPPSCPQERT